MGREDALAENYMVLHLASALMLHFSVPSDLVAAIKIKSRGVMFNKLHPLNLHGPTCS